MEFPPQKFREIVFQLLFSIDGSSSAEAELIPLLMRELAVSKKHVSAAYSKAQKIWKLHADLDAVIAEKSKSYSLERIKTVEKNVLRIAIYEIKFEQAPLEIVISEAYRIARKFGSLEGASFVNAILDRKQDHGSAISTPEGDQSQ